MGLVRPSLFVLSAPSGSGKTSLVRQALGRLKFLTLSVSTTTRPPRSGETEGVDYHFASQKEFLDAVALGDFVEWAEVYGNLYGTSKVRLEQAQAKGYSVLLDVDVQGAMQLMQVPHFNAQYLFVRPPSLSDLRTRLIKRGSETEVSLEQRLNSAEHELTFQDQYDHVILNDDLEQATEAFFQVLIEKSVDFSLLEGVCSKDAMRCLAVNPQDPLVFSIINKLQSPHPRA